MFDYGIVEIRSSEGVENKTGMVNEVWREGRKISDGPNCALGGQRGHSWT